MPKIANLSDEQLVCYVCDYDKEQYREIVARYQKKLLRYAGFLVNDSEAAQDVVQQAFIKAFINLKSFNAKRKFSSWLFRIVHNEAVNFVKQKKRETSFDDKIGEDTTGKFNNGIDEMLANKEQAEFLKKCLAQLPIDYKAPLTLFYFENKSYEEISDILRLPIGTVGTRINRGKTKLKELFLSKGGKYD